MFSTTQRLTGEIKLENVIEFILFFLQTSRAEDIELPIRIVKVRQDLLDEREDDFYQVRPT